MESSLIGKKVKFSKNKDIQIIGIVLDKILMINKPTEIEPNTIKEVVTGYIIQSLDGVLYNSVHHWRIISIIEEKKELPLKDFKF